MALFNHFIATTYSSTLSFEEENHRVEDIILFCQKHKLESTEFLCHRYQSFRYFEKKEYQKAIESLIGWMEKHENLTKSDYELAVLHIADCFFEIGDLRKAIFYYDKISDSIDERVRFPKSFLGAKIFRTDIDIDDFPLVSSHWKERYVKYKTLSRIHQKNVLLKDIILWNFKTGVLSKGRTLKGKIKAQSLEGQLLRLLMAEPKSKSQLCESLWPLEMETVFLDDRFHQLIQRVNRKIKEAVIYDGRLYKLGNPIKKWPL